MVRYSRTLVSPKVGFSAIIVLAEQHHTIAKEDLEYHDNVVTTSTVQEVEEGTGRFWTLNTFYVPDERPQKSPD